MTYTRHIGALSALALTLVLGACSTPEDLTAPMLEPQFGTAEDDIGTHVSYVSTGRIYSFAKEFGYAYRQDADGVYGYGKVILRRFDGSGNLAWSREIASRFCNDVNYDDCQTLTPESLEANSQGYVFALYSEHTQDVQDCGNEDSYYVSKVDSTGQVNTIYLPSNGFGPSDDDAAMSYTPSIGMAVDGSGNIYVAQQKGDFDDEYCGAIRSNIVAKYSPTGALLWQRTSTVGVPTDITVSSSGSVYVAGSAGYARYSSTGGLTWTKTGASDDIIVSGSNLYTRDRTTIRRHDSTGKTLWSRTQSGLSSLVVADITGDGSGNVYLAGKYSATSTNRDAFTRKLNSSGSVVWTKPFGTSAYDDALGIATITGSEIYTTGSTQGTLSHANMGGSDAYLRKTNSSGDRVWTR